MSTERRPSIAERRSSTTTNTRPQFDSHLSTTNETIYNDGGNQQHGQGQGQFSTSRRPSVVPHLAGLEKPLPESIPEQCDVVIAGTGLVESILAAALAWQGSNVLHIDSNDHYGDNTATLTIDQIKNWVVKVNKNEIIGFKNALLYIPSGNELFKSKDFGLDLTPKILFAKSDLLSLLIKSRVYKYLEFLPLSSFHFFENDNFEKMSNTKQDIFTNQSLSLLTKRSLMKFIKFAIDWENQPQIWESYKKKPMEIFLNEQFKLEKPQIWELIFSIGLCNNLKINTPEALLRIKRYLISFDVYGNFPVMYSKYGGAGEISQGFCRSAAVAGTTYKLNTKLESFDPKNKIAKFSDNSRIRVNEQIILSPSQAPNNAQNIPKQEYEIQRLTVIVKKTCKEWFENGESASIVVFPSGSLSTNNSEAVQALIMSEETGITAPDTCVWYLSTTEKGLKGRHDLENALKKMENSILRESSDLNNEDELFDNGTGILNSVKLGQSFKDFVPKEKIQYLLKLYYIQKTSIPHADVVKPSIYKKNLDNNNNTSTENKDAPDNGVIYSTLPSSEISYDGIITAAKILYEKIVGSDDDFFDVDFEDDDENDENNGINNKNNDELAFDDDISETVEFADDMEL
ncbi:Rab proteins geranylgeranyltransferase component A [Wickerhamomyces ciferrii]|uniref:Rab proteins geranylgeranyltransferase component A n=1 Tax=Wickerhamomyces ciferrii (strain ATCC 14091 / BCRC 22168 / CBS 111 / JCM 3599 / NBRC 0793 / NRRL Y-1031 F-60-10) TaxID=1206466 RepID=K0KNT5_WICCF|nr:Rab proteins geranylgeranyltransferase component A [Wickerhamomyces ciferrii]CCH44646.1 Rab proteins geranylgeranyltransferase component A [Wickerhamomyces ciferrii]